MKIGVYICHCGTNIAATVNVEEVAEFARSLPDVAVAKHYIYVCSDPGQELVRNDIKEFGLDRVVIASCSPAMHQIVFMDNVQKTGLNPYFLERANIREQCSWVHSDIIAATEKAKRLIAAAVVKASRLEPLEAKEVSVIPAALVIGGGIAGIQAALDLGNAGFEVYLIEREPYIGGHVAQLERTFPTLEHTDHIIKSMVADLMEHPKIKPLAYSEVIGVEGYIGNFKVKVRRKPRYIDTDKCTRCGACVEVCPAIVPNEFDLGLSKRSAVYLPPGGIQYLIDPEACLYFQEGGCQVCKEVCEPDAIKFDQKEENIEIEVGAIIIATGYDIFDARLKPEYGYGSYPNVITAPEFERLCSTSGPTRGRIQIDGRAPQNVVFIQCVGSRDKSVGIEYCSRVCCMYTAKQAHRVKEEIPEAKVTICYIDIRAFGKGHEQFYERVQREGVIYRRGSVSEIYKRREKLVVRAEDTLLGEPFEEEADLVVLATGLVPRKGFRDLMDMLKVAQSPDGFFLEAHPKLGPVETIIEGIFLAGCCQGPKDITDTIAQAHAAAGKASIPLFLGKVRKEPLTSLIDEEVCSGCRICEKVCEYGALSFDERRRIMTVNEILCRGCGACSIACPSGANQIRNFTKKQALEMITALI